MSLIGKLKYRKPVPIGESRAKRGHSSSIPHKHSTHKRSDTNQSPAERLDEKIFTRDLEENLAIFENLFGMNMDLLIRRFQIQIQSSRIHCAIIYLDSSSSKADINEILRALIFDIDQSDQTGLPVWDMVISQCIPYADVTIRKCPEDATDWLLSGNSLLFIDGWDEVIGLSTQAFKERGIKEPATEQVIQGPRDGFIESIGTNISLLRKRMRSPNLRIKLIQLGRESATNIVYCYCEGIVNKDLVNEVEKRLRLIDTDAIYGAGFLEQYIEDNHYYARRQ